MYAGMLADNSICKEAMPILNAAGHLVPGTIRFSSLPRIYNDVYGGAFEYATVTHWQKERFEACLRVSPPGCVGMAILRVCLKI